MVDSPISSDEKHSSKRLHLLDVLRGFSIASMIGFHLCYDLKYIYGVALPWFAPPLQDIWRASISWTFLLIAGCTCALSRNNLVRACRYGVLAFAIYLATSLANVDEPISFGIIYCMAACTLTSWVLEQLHIAPRGPRAAFLLAVLFVLLLPLGSGYIGIGPWRIAVPAWPYDVGFLSWLGFPGPTFASGDYYPLLPYVLLYLSGSAMGWWWKERGFPRAFYECHCEPLEFVGRHPLVVYVAHQPVLLLVASLIS